MKRLAAAFTLVAAACLAGCAHYEVIGYYAGWKPLPTLAPRELTGINYAFAYVLADGSIALDDAQKDAATLARLVGLKEGTPGLKVMIAVGGWTRSNRFSDMAASPAARATFIDSTLAFLRRHRIDGIDIDWEYPTEIGVPCAPGETCQRPEDKRNFVQLGMELRAALDAAGRADGKRYLATIAAGADEKFLADPHGKSAWLRELAESLDWINLMTYDYHGSWEQFAGLNAPLARDPNDPADANVEASVKRLLATGIPASKIVLGLPFYGKKWSACAPGSAGDGLYQPCAGLDPGSSLDFVHLTDRGYLSRDVSGLFTVAGPAFTRHWNEAARVPYLYQAITGDFITYDDEASIRAKTEVVRKYGLRGAMFWEIGADANGVLRRVLSDGLR